jgi:hypothetical protein
MATGTRKVALVALLILAAVVAPIAVPIRMLIARRQRPTTRTEQVVRTDRSGDPFRRSGV